LYKFTKQAFVPLYNYIATTPIQEFQTQNAKATETCRKQKEIKTTANRQSDEDPQPLRPPCMN
jgi:hypothetical protein